MTTSRLHTIRRNTKRFRLALETARDCKVYAERNYFNGEECNALALVQYMNGEGLMGDTGKLTSRESGRFTLHVHGNLWFEFTADA